MNNTQSHFYCLCRNVDVRINGSKSDVITTTTNLFTANEKSIGQDIYKKGEKSPPISSSVTNGESDTTLTSTSLQTQMNNGGLSNALRQQKKAKVISGKRKHN